MPAGKKTPNLSDAFAGSTPDSSYVDLDYIDHVRGAIGTIHRCSSWSGRVVPAGQKT